MTDELGAAGFVHRARVAAIRLCALCVSCAWGVFGVSCVSCISGHGIVAADVSPAGWRDAVELRYFNADTLNLKELTFAMRYDPIAAETTAETRDCTTNSAASGGFVGPTQQETPLFCVIDARSPSGVVARDTLAVGHLLTGNGHSLRELRMHFRQHVRFTERGDYTFAITPSTEMRGVWSVALEMTISD